MRQITFGFIGCGNMGGALLEAVAQSVDSACISICDQSIEKLEYYQSKLGVHAVEIEKAISDCDFIFLGVKPQSYPALFDSIRPMLANRTELPILISMAAGISISAVASMAGINCGIIRIMPNTPVSVGEGMILYTCNEAVSDQNLETFLNAMKKAGMLDSIPEDKIDAASALSGCGPAFVFMFAEALADGAVECGLPRDRAMLYASQTLLGAAKLMLESGKHPGELKDAVCSPGGTTIAGVHSIENGGLRSCAMDAVNASYRRTLELKK